MNKEEAERAVLTRLDGISEVVLIPYKMPPYEAILTTKGIKGVLEKVSGKDVLYYIEVEKNESNERRLFRRN